MSKSTKPRAECQVCEKVWALISGGQLGHHGYQRPGYGYILGDCAGEGHLPFPATSALESYLTKTILPRLAKIPEELAALLTVGELTETSQRFDSYRGHSEESVLIRRDGSMLRTRKTKALGATDWVEFKGYRHGLDYGEWHTSQTDAFQQMANRKRADLLNEQKWFQAEETRVRARIEKGLALRAVKEAGCQLQSGERSPGAHEDLDA